jgi:hypothetical protein
MDKIRTLVVDDELPARRRVLELLEKPLLSKTGQTCSVAC